VLSSEKSPPEELPGLGVEFVEVIAGDVDRDHAGRFGFETDHLHAVPRRAPNGAQESMPYEQGADDDVKTAPRHARERIGDACGGDVAINFRVDPALIAGLELNGPNLAVSNSWRADLARILAGVNSGGETKDGLLSQPGVEVVRADATHAD